MAASTVTERYAAPPEAAWALVGDFEHLDKTFDALEDLVVDGDVRTFTLMGMRISERLVARDEASRTITYSIVDGVPIDAHEATIHVEAIDDGCEISWSVTSDPEAAQPLFVDSYRGALVALHPKLDAK